MPIKDCPVDSFISYPTSILLPIIIINPENNKSYKTKGLIDTGACDCAIPADIAKILGHNLILGYPKIIGTGNGDSLAYSHTSTIQIFHPEKPDGNPIYTLDNVLIDFMPNLHFPLLGVNGFLSEFILSINYPKRIFSLLK